MTEPGDYVLACRAYDDQGEGQDEMDENLFNYFSMSCMIPHQVCVKVTDAVTEPAEGTRRPIGAHVDLSREVYAQKKAVPGKPFNQEVYTYGDVMEVLTRAPGSQG